jgi:glycosyltransferase involved in cell wall biosynthesis
MPAPRRLKVAALIDLPRSTLSGGHVKSWERMTAAAARLDLPFDLTSYFSGPASVEELAPHVRIKQMPPVFSTAQLKFLPYVPDHTDLANYHPALAKELAGYDVIHTTDGYFAFSQTAMKVSQQHKIPLLSSIHTDTPSYTRIFTRQTITKLLGQRLGGLIDDRLKLAERAGRAMQTKLIRHLQTCQGVFAFRQEDWEFAASIVGEERMQHLRLGYDQIMTGPHRADRAGIERDYHIPPQRVILLFVGRVDIGKNIYTLVSAMERLLAEGLPLHVITAGKGPAEQEVGQRLGSHATVAGFVAPDELSRLYASVDGLALVSEVETRSMACAEALVSHCPVLVSAATGIANYYDNMTALMSVSSGAEAWADAIRRFALNADLRAAMRQSAQHQSGRYLPVWEQVVAEDLWPVWQKAAR